METTKTTGLWWTIYKVPLVVAGFASIAFGVLEYLRRKAPDDGTWFLGVLGLAAVWGLWSLGDWLEKLPARPLSAEQRKQWKHGGESAFILIVEGALKWFMSRPIIVRSALGYASATVIALSI